MSKTQTRSADVGNLAFARAMHGKHNLTHADKRTKRVKTRAAAKARAVKEQA